MGSRNRARERAKAAKLLGPNEGPASAATSRTSAPIHLPALIDTEEGAARLAAHLLDPTRSRVTTLVTRPSGSSAALVDLAWVREQVGDLADVFEVCNGRVGLALSRALGPYSVYGGACRAYPRHDEWPDPTLLPIRFVWSPARAANSASAIVSDTLRLVQRGTQIRTGAPMPASIEVSGIVLGVVAGRALVMLNGGGNASIHPELVAGGLTAEQLFTAGMKVSGLLDRASGRMDVTRAIRSPEAALAAYRVGDTVACRVAAVGARTAEVELYPGVVLPLPRDLIVEPGRSIALSELVAAGEIVLARVSATPADGGWALSMLDVEPDDEPVPAPGLLDGGPAWITPVDLLATLDEPATPQAVDAGQVASRPEPEPEPATPVSPAPAPVTSDVVPAAALASMRAERDQLLSQLERAEARAEQSYAAAARQRARVRQVEGELAAANRRIGKAMSAVQLIEAEAGMFADPEEQLRFEVQLAWARRIPAAEKAAKPLGSYSIGPDFLDTLSDVEGIDRGKVVDVMVEVACGIAWSVAGRELHQLRTGPGGNDPARVRADGATGWRASLQCNAAAARRLHFWMLNDGTVEFSSVRVHNDMRS